MSNTVDALVVISDHRSRSARRVVVVVVIGHDGAINVEVVENASTDGRECDDEQISIVVPPLAAAAAAAATAAAAAVAIVRERFLLLRGLVVLVPQFFL